MYSFMMCKLYINILTTTSSQPVNEVRLKTRLSFPHRCLLFPLHAHATPSCSALRHQLLNLKMGYQFRNNHFNYE